MPRAANVFYNLVTDENSTTELFCNLMRFSAFRLPFLRLFLPDEIAMGVAWEDIETQIDLGACGRPDMQVRNPDLVALIEIKVTPGLAPTPNQPGGYLDFLRRQDARERWLVFLVPRRWAHLGGVKLELAAISPDESGGKVRSRIIGWEEVVDLIEENDLAELNPFLRDFHELLRARVGARSVSFTAKEILMLFSNEIPTVLSNLQQLVDGIRDLSSTHTIKPSASRSLYPSEYGLYFLDPNGKAVLWFGVWMQFWIAHGAPLCFGLIENSSEPVKQAFLSSYKGPTKHFEKHILAWFGPEALSAENAIDQVWAQLSPLVEVTLAARSAELGIKLEMER